MKTNIFFACLFVSGLISAQELTNKKGSEYKFTVVKNIEGTPVQNQNITGTCWSFSSLSFLESEIIRLGKGKEFNLTFFGNIIGIKKIAKHLRRSSINKPI